MILGSCRYSEFPEINYVHPKVRFCFLWPIVLLDGRFVLTTDKPRSDEVDEKTREQKTMERERIARA